MRYGGYKLNSRPEERPGACDGCDLCMPNGYRGPKCIIDRECDAGIITPAQAPRECFVGKTIYTFCTQKGRAAYIAGLARLKLKGEI